MESTWSISGLGFCSTLATELSIFLAKSGQLSFNCPLPLRLFRLNLLLLNDFFCFLSNGQFSLSSLTFCE